MVCSVPCPQYPVSLQYLAHWSRAGPWPGSMPVRCHMRGSLHGVPWLGATCHGAVSGPQVTYHHTGGTVSPVVGSTVLDIVLRVQHQKGWQDGIMLAISMGRSC